MPDRNETQNQLRKDILAARARAMLASFDEQTRPQIIEAVKLSIELLAEFADDLETRAVFAETIAALVGQLMSVPAYAISDTLEHTTAAYLIAGAVLHGAFDLPEGSGEEVDGSKVDAPTGTPEAVQEALSDLLPTLDAGDDFRPGNYL